MKQKESWTTCNPDTCFLSIMKTKLRESAFQHMAGQLDASCECTYLYVSVCISMYSVCIILYV